jgi:hypothetical protein
MVSLDVDRLDPEIVSRARQTFVVCTPEYHVRHQFLFEGPAVVLRLIQNDLIDVSTAF